MGSVVDHDRGALAGAALGEVDADPIAAAAVQADIAQAWQRIRGRVRDWNDLEPALIGRVEELIDFVTAEAE